LFLQRDEEKGKWFLVSKLSSPLKRAFGWFLGGGRWKVAIAVLLVGVLIGIYLFGYFMGKRAERNRARKAFMDAVLRARDRLEGGLESKGLPKWLQERFDAFRQRSGEEGEEGNTGLEEK